MHIRTNIELNMVHLAVLAVCPLMMVVVSAKQALLLVIATFLCYLISALLCYALNKYLSRNIKIFITAVLSTFIITLLNLLLKKYEILGFKASDFNFFAVLSVVVLSVDIYFIDTKAVVNNYILRVIISAFAFALITLIYSMIREFMSFGTLFETQVTSFDGEVFCRSAAFGLMLLGIIAVIAEIIYRTITAAIGDKKIAYQKFVKLIREEKEFQYDSLRRNSLLASEIETNKVNNDDMNKIIDKTNNNEVGVLEEEPKEGTEEEVPDESVKKRKTKKNKKLKFSKEAKVEKLFDQSNNKQGEDEWLCLKHFCLILFYMD